MQKDLEQLAAQKKPGKHLHVRLRKRLLNNSELGLKHKILLLEQLAVFKRQAELSQDPIKQTHYNTLKNRLKALMAIPNSVPQESWKDALFCSNNQAQRAYLANFEHSGLFHVNQRSEVADFQTYQQPQLHYSAALGITHADNRTDPNEKTELCLDAEYQLEETGTTVDGIGVYQSIENNQHILKSSKLTAKIVTRLCHAYADPEALFRALPWIFQQSRHLIKKHFEGAITESACCVMTKVFAHNDECVEVISAGVGDCLAFAWLPEQNRVVTLSSAKQYDYGVQFNPLSVTDALSESMIQRSRILLPNTAIIFRMTDGAWQMLPNQTSKKQVDVHAKRHFIETVIDHKAMATLLSQFTENNPNATEVDYRDFLLQHITKKINALKLTAPELFQTMLPDKLDAYKQAHQTQATEPTFAEFSPWFEDQEPETHAKLIETLSQLECVMDLLSNVTIQELCQSFTQKLELGDDTTLSVQSLSSLDLNRNNIDARTTNTRGY